MRTIQAVCEGGEIWEVEALVADRLCYHFTLHDKNLFIITHVPTGKFLPGTETADIREAHFLLKRLLQYPGWDSSENSLWEQREALKARIKRARYLFSAKISLKYCTH